jgi:hypothetical protein
LEAWSVVQVITADVEVIPVACTPEIAGGGVVVKVAFGDVVDAVDAFTEVTSKSYCVPGVRPVSVTVCVVVDPVPLPVEP